MISVLISCFFNISLASIALCTIIPVAKMDTSEPSITISSRPILYSFSDEYIVGTGLLPVRINVGFLLNNAASKTD